MLFKFNTDNEIRAKAALLLYAAYRSRQQTSSLNGLETWTRFVTYIRGAYLKSETTAEFITNFCKMAGVGSIKPKYFETNGGMTIVSDGMLIQSDSIKEYHPEIIEDDSLMKIYENESQLIVMLIRDRIQREKMEGVVDDEEVEDQI